MLLGVAPATGNAVCKRYQAGMLLSMANNYIEKIFTLLCALVAKVATFVLS